MRSCCCVEWVSALLVSSLLVLLLVPIFVSGNSERRKRSGYMSIPRVDHALPIQSLFKFQELPQLSLRFNGFRADSFPLLFDSDFYGKHPSATTEQTKPKEQSAVEKCCSAYRECYRKSMKKPEGPPPLPIAASECYVAQHPRNGTSPETTLDHHSQLRGFCEKNQEIFLECMKEMVSFPENDGLNRWAWLEKCHEKKKGKLTPMEKFIKLLAEDFKYLCTYHYFQARDDETCFRNKTRDCVMNYNRIKCMKSCESSGCTSEFCAANNPLSAPHTAPGQKEYVKSEPGVLSISISGRITPVFVLLILNAHFQLWFCFRCA